ncbi:hypothetical protein HMPREF9019_0208 [Hoylesella timonensis CRIS 5C-B1]|uniref:Uncharacterized protein n=1 Tax=Hoylesella timonensis CRIS 5C-B1 TaxID=679189 RepID=D1W214_9BACT|nr:hypothetical protein HMPREF9019_0208 [Hoylesella timonensis CRIS 5C-B1]
MFLHNVDVFLIKPFHKIFVTFVLFFVKTSFFMKEPCG